MYQRRAVCLRNIRLRQSTATANALIIGNELDVFYGHREYLKDTFKHEEKKRLKQKITWKFVYILAEIDLISIHSSICLQFLFSFFFFLVGRKFFAFCIYFIYWKKTCPKVGSKKKIKCRLKRLAMENICCLIYNEKEKKTKTMKKKKIEEKTINSYERFDEHLKSYPYVCTWTNKVIV